MMSNMDIKYQKTTKLNAIDNYWHIDGCSIPNLKEDNTDVECKVTKKQEI